jgi:hypothetical protein
METYAALLFVLFTEKCDHYKKVEQIIEIMREHQGATTKYTVHRCRLITWIIIVDSRHFFSKRVTKDEMAQGLPGPTSRLSGYLFDLAMQHQIFCETLPTQWRGAKKKEAPPSKPSGPSPFVPPVPPAPQRQQQQAQQQRAAANVIDSKLAHVHPIIRQKLKPFHMEFEGRIDLREMLSAANKSHRDLPWHETSGDRLCWKHALGFCDYNNCSFDHLPANKISDDVANKVCQVLQPGIVQLLANPPQNGYLVKRYQKRSKQY